MQKKVAIGRNFRVNLDDRLHAFGRAKKRPMFTCLLFLLVSLGTCPGLAAEPEGLPFSSVSAQREQPPPEVHARLLNTILEWLSADFPPPANYQHPRVKVVSSEELAEIRIRGSDTALQARDFNDEHRLQNIRDTVALYETDSRTIYLRQGWTGETTTETSVLVHELVHHLQNLAGDRFACPQEREKAAYAAQRKWLEKAGLDFFTEFETDPMTLMVRTSCGF